MMVYGLARIFFEAIVNLIIVCRQQTNSVRNDLAHESHGALAFTLSKTRVITLPLRCTAPMIGLLPVLTGPVMPWWRLFQ
jgi:hypothetical protein